MTENRTPLFPYDVAPPGSPDKYRTLRDVDVVWERVPKRWARLVRRPVDLPEFGCAWAVQAGADGSTTFVLTIREPFYFSVSVAPDDPAAEPAACLHDFIYTYVDALAEAQGCSVRQMLALADHWFLALLRHYGFRYSALYFRGVSLFGFWFNRASRWIRRVFG